MALVKTPVCEFGKKAPDFRLLSVDGKYYSLSDCSKRNGVVVMFICNHCPYVKAILPRLLQDVATLEQLEVGCVAICSNDPTHYSEDSYENMRRIAKELAFTFPYLVDETQQIAKNYGAVCTPDFFGYNSNFLLQYRGNVEALVEAMKGVIATGKGPKNQIASQGCSIKWH